MRTSKAYVARILSAGRAGVKLWSAAIHRRFPLFRLRQFIAAVLGVT
jgi:hypothetical protein